MIRNNAPLREQFGLLALAWHTRTDPTPSVVKDGATGEGELYPRDPEVGESVLAKTLASSLKLALTTNEALDQQLAAAKAEIERLKGELTTGGERWAEHWQWVSDELKIPRHRPGAVRGGAEGPEHQGRRHRWRDL